MQRYNVFHQIHKGLRAMLYDTALVMQQTDFINPEEAEVVLQSMGKVLDCFHSHASQEDKFILPNIQSFDPHLVTEFEREHEMGESLSSRLFNLVPVYDKAVSGDAKAEVGYAILKAFKELVAFNLCHMDKEEEKINGVLWANYSDAEIKDVHRSILANLPASIMDYEGRWMMKGIRTVLIIN